MHTKFYVNETPSNSGNEELLKPCESFLGNPEFLNISSHLECRESDVILQSLCFSAVRQFLIVDYKGKKE